MSKLYEAALDQEEINLEFAEKERDFDLSQQAEGDAGILWSHKTMYEDARLDYELEPTAANLMRMNRLREDLQFWARIIAKDSSPYYGEELTDFSGAIPGDR